MKKMVALSLLCLSTSTFAASLTIPDFSIRLVTENPSIDLNRVELRVEEYCEKINLMTTYHSGAQVFKNVYRISGNANNEYDIPGKRLKCSSIAGVRLYYDIYTSTGQYVHREEVQGYGDVTVSSEALAKRFAKPVNVE